MSKPDPRVIIIGGGPAGLVLSIELGRRGVSCLVLDQGSGQPSFPKANSTTARTMEHFRRLGVAEDVRQIGLPDDYAPDISYHTRYSEHELARLHWPSRTEALAKRLGQDSRWPTPEPMHRGQQMFIEPILKRHAATLNAVDLRFGHRATAVQDLGDRVRVSATNLESGESCIFEADYVIGCEGPRSLVRNAIGTNYEGLSGEVRDFMGGRMMATFLNAPAFYEQGPATPSWQYWCINPERRGIMMAIDGKGLFAFHTQLTEGQEPTESLAREAFVSLVGKNIPHEIIGVAEWTAGFTLVSERMSSGRMFLAGDAAHLFTPTAGLGYNTSVDDVANLGWKLAAVLQGWGGEKLLDSYEAERRPIAQRNTGFARSLAEFFRHLDLPDVIEAAGPAGDAARRAYGERLYAFAQKEFDAPGIILGVFYGSSPIIMAEGGPAPKDEPNHYVPHARPGARAPHIWLPDGRALFDILGPDFTVLKLSEAADATSLEAAARNRGVPVQVAEWDNLEARDLYAADLVLIRPDQHVAWRGNVADAAAAELILAKATGFAIDADAESGGGAEAGPNAALSAAPSAYNGSG